MVEERPKPAPAPEHGREEAAQEEEQRHPPEMDVLEEGVEESAPSVALLPVRNEGDGGVQHAAEQHRGPAERIEVVAATVRRYEFDGDTVGAGWGRKTAGRGWRRREGHR